jgi:hypothetical protein
VHIIWYFDIIRLSVDTVAPIHSVMMLYLITTFLTLKVQMIHTAKVTIISHVYTDIANLDFVLKYLIF